MPLYLYKYLRHSERLTKHSLLTLILLKELSKMYFTKTQTLETFKEIYNDDLKELHGQKKIKDSLFKSHVQSLIEAKLLNPNKVKSWVNPF